VKQYLIVLLSLLATLVALAAAILNPATVGAAGATATALTLQAGPRTDENGNEVKGQLVLTATLKTADGKPLSDRSVSFYEQVTFLGQPRQALLGTAITDSTGAAGIVYQPARKGKDAIIARFASSGGYQGAEAKMSLDVEQVVPAFAAEPVPLAGVGAGLAIAFAVLVVGVWAILLTVFLRTVIGIRVAARSAASRAASEAPSSVLAQSRNQL